MKSLLLTLPFLFATWFYRGQSPSEERTHNERGQSPSQGEHSRRSVTEWPSSLPVFGEIDANGMVTVRRDGNSTFACFIDPAPPANVLDRASAAFSAAGWEVAPIGTCDMVIFIRGEAVAAVLAENNDGGSRVTAVQRLSKH